MPLDINREIDRVKAVPIIGPLLANGLERIQTALNAVATNMGGDTEILPPPPKVQKLNIKGDGLGAIHAVIEDNNPIQKGIRYFVEYDTNPAFTQPHVIHLGTSRSFPPFLLPSLDDNGAPQLWHFRAYSSYPGGDPNEPINFGGNTPTPVDPGGGVHLTLLPSTGSGTAQSSGQQGGSGFGKFLFRRVLGPKRSG